MKAEKCVLIQEMPGLYAVGTAILGGEPYYLAASEIPGGKVAAVHCDTNEVHYIEGGRGGVMGIMPSVKENCLLSIEEFYPGFDAPHSKIVEIRLEMTDGKWKTASRKELAEVPYLHRLGVLKEKDGYFLAAGRLCTRKDYVQDWDHPGFLEMLSFDADQVTGRETLTEGIVKHHAMLVEKRPEGDIVYYGGDQGLFRSVRENGRWMTDRLLDVPTSEIVFEDLDGDGVRELAIVEQFHGGCLTIFKDRGNGYERVFEYPLTLGHALWGGMLAGSVSLVSGSRDGTGELTVRRFGTDADGNMQLKDELVADTGIGPAQICIRDLGDKAEILVSCYLIGQLAKYTITNS